MNCAQLEKCLHEAREEAQTYLCAAERRVAKYTTLRVSAIKMRGLSERLRTCVSSVGMVAFSDSLYAFAQSLAMERTDLLEKSSKAEAANEQLNKELEEKKELINTLYVKHQLEKQANKDKISFNQLEVHKIAAFVLNSSGHYEAINRTCPHYYLSAESIALFSENLPNHPMYIIGQVVHIERGVVKTYRSALDQAKNRGSTSNPYGLPVGCEYFVVTVAMLPNNSGAS